ncbi:MAG: ATP-binding protein [Pseudomonadota bacterium]
MSEPDPRSGVSLAMLHVFYGRIASGKSTLAAEIAASPDSILISEDAWLHALFAEDLNDLDDFIRCSKKLRAAMQPHIVGLLNAGLTVVLDFAANTPQQRAWMKRMAQEAGVDHRLHVITTPDETCLARLRARNASGDHPFAVSEAQFHQFSKYVSLPSEEEGFNIISHDPT